MALNRELFDEYAPEDKIEAVKKVARLATHNAFTKDDILHLLRFMSNLFDEMWEGNMCTSITYWHDLKENPKDLPEPGREKILLYAISPLTGLASLSFGRYERIDDGVCCFTDSHYEYGDNDVLAWCKPRPPQKVKVV